MVYASIWYFRIVSLRKGKENHINGLNKNLSWSTGKEKTMRRRQLTEAERQRSAERKEKLRGIVKQIAAMTPENRQLLAMKVTGIVTCEGRALSVHNQCMIAFQSPFATVIGGFQQWRRIGRQVRKGEHGFVIWAPAGEGKPVDETLQPPADNGKPERKRFILVTMFDVAQTDEIGAVVESAVPA